LQFKKEEGLSNKWKKKKYCPDPYQEEVIVRKEETVKRGRFNNPKKYGWKKQCTKRN